MSTRKSPSIHIMENNFMQFCDLLGRLCRLRPQTGHVDLFHGPGMYIYAGSFY